MISACVNKILLPTPQAKGPFRKFYRDALERNDAEIRAIAEATQKKEYYFTSLDGSSMIDLDLSKAELAIYARASTEDIAEVRRMISRHPDTWREELLRARGCPDAAQRLIELRRLSDRASIPLQPGLAIA
jgi:type IV secretory pathway VirB4 component